MDTTGELRDWYACADVVFIGKSLTGTGGQNPVEAILAGRPVLFGPHMENFGSLAKTLLDAGGALEVGDAASSAAASVDLLSDGDRRATVASGDRRAPPAPGATARTATSSNP